MQKGQRIRDYELEERIGEGGMGEVWRALHLVLHRRVAVKAMFRHLAQDPQFEQRFVMEARTLAALDHPRILGVTDFFSEAGVYYLVMPFVDGQSLDERLAGAGPLSSQEATIIATDMLDALDYAHMQGVIHRDVKPSNIMLDRRGHAYLMDFGIALLIGHERRTRTGTSLGTPHYMSPEQIRRPRSVDHRADLYSAGCVVYEMLAGRPPFLADEDQGDTDFVLKEAHLYQQALPIRTWNPAIPEWLDRVVLRALCKEPNERYGGCGEFLRALESKRTPTVVEEPPPPAPPPPRVPAPPAPTPPPVPPPYAGIPPPVTTARPPSPPPPVRKHTRGRTVASVSLLGVLILILVGVLTSRKPGETIEETTPVTTSTETTSTEMATGLSAMGTDGMGTGEIEPGTVPTQATATATSGNLPARSEPAASTETTGMSTDFAPPDGTGVLIANATRKLGDGLSENLDVKLDTGGHTYVMVGDCDADCSDLDFVLYDPDGKQIDFDTKSDKFPVVAAAVAQPATLRLEVRMVHCSANPCEYTVKVYMH
jgi:serine/threonine protein kinase